jgi:hypothetical protein
LLPLVRLLARDAARRTVRQGVIDDQLPETKVAR